MVTELPYTSALMHVSEKKARPTLRTRRASSSQNHYSAIPAPSIGSTFPAVTARSSLPLDTPPPNQDHPQRRIGTRLAQWTSNNARHVNPQHPNLSGYLDGHDETNVTTTVNRHQRTSRLLKKTPPRYDSREPPPTTCVTTDSHTSRSATANYTPPVRNSGNSTNNTTKQPPVRQRRLARYGKSQSTVRTIPRFHVVHPQSVPRSHPPRQHTSPEATLNHHRELLQCVNVPILGSLSFHHTIPNVPSLRAPSVRHRGSPT